MNHGASAAAATQRVVALVDMDCFYCQVEAKLNPSLKGKPVAVVQYNKWKGGGIIAVNYEARDRGVSRHMRGDEAKKICPEIVLARVPTIRGKADLSNYRNAGDEVAKVFSEFSDCVQRASIDEAYLDLTKAVQESIKNQNENLKPEDLPNTFVVGYCNQKNRIEEERQKGLTEWLRLVESQKTNDLPDYQLAIGAKIVEKMRMEIFNRTGFHCSAGIAHNKILAKLTAGLHKPKRQTVLPQDSVPELYETLSIFKVRSLGGKLGKHVSEKLSIKYMSELYKYSLQELQQKFDEKTSYWLYNIARGIDLDPVTSRLRPESIGCCKNFTGNNMLKTKSKVRHWLTELATEISERLTKDSETNKRKAKLLTVSFSQNTSMTRCGPLNSYDKTRIVNDAIDLIKKFNNAAPNEDVWDPPIKFLGLSASKFSEELASIEKYFKNCKNSEGGDAFQRTPRKSSAKGRTFKNGMDKYLKAVNNTNEECGTSKDQKPSFFMDFFNMKKDDEELEEEQDEEAEGRKEGDREVEEQEEVERGQVEAREVERGQVEAREVEKEQVEAREVERGQMEARKVKRELVEGEEEEEEEEAWISLSEVFPDMNEVKADVVEMLPEPLQKKFKQRLGCRGENSERFIPVRETCAECGESIPLDELLEHSDYHAALKLNSELNKTVCVNGGVIEGRKSSKESDGLGKRKKKNGLTPVKKMKSITSFFNVLPKD